MKPRPLRASVYAAPGAASRPPRYATPATLAAPSAAAPTRWPSPARLNCQVRSSAAPCSGGAGMARCGTPAHRVSHQVCHWLADTARPCSSHCTRRPPSQAPRQASRQAQPATRHACHAADAVRCSAATRAGVQRSASNTTRPGCKQECGYHLLSLIIGYHTSPYTLTLYPTPNPIPESRTYPACRQAIRVKWLHALCQPLGKQIPTLCLPPPLPSAEIKACDPYRSQRMPARQGKRCDRGPRMHHERATTFWAHKGATHEPS